MDQPTTTEPGTSADQPTAEEESQPTPVEEQGAGSKAAVLADLAKERDQRQKLQAQLDEQAKKLTAVLTALGHQQNEDLDPKALSNQLTDLQRENSILRHGATIANVDALLDSRDFTKTLADLKNLDADTVKDHITTYVSANPRFALTPTAPTGQRDAAAGAKPNNQPTDVQQWVDAIFES